MPRTPQHILDKINQAKKDKAKTLNLAHTRYSSFVYRQDYITQIPSEVFELEQLEVLDVSYTWIHTIPAELTRLQKLKEIRVLGNHLRSVIDIPGLVLDWRIYQKFKSQLSRENISGIRMRASELEALSDLANFANLTSLDLRNTRLSKLPESITKLANLISLDLSSNKLTQVPDFLTHFPGIKKIDLQSKYGIGTGTLGLAENPITHPPLAVVERGLEAIRNFYTQSAGQGKSKLYEAKLLLVGEPGAGKTSLLKKLCDENYPIPNKKEESTVGIRIRTGWAFPFLQDNKIEFTGNLWDFGGQEIQYMTHQFFLTSRALYVLVADDRKQLTNFDYWFEIIKLLGNGSPVLVVLNENQYRSITNFDYDNFRKYYEKEFTIERCEVNLADQNLDRFRVVRSKIHQMLCELPHVGDELPAQWPKIRQELDKCREKKYIPVDEYAQICREHHIEKREDQLVLSQYLHDLGIILHFQDDANLGGTIFLNPQWCVDAVYTILDSDHAKNNHGRFTQDWMFELWRDKGQPFQHAFLRARILDVAT